jgi:hypothetical protein
MIYLQGQHNSAASRAVHLHGAVASDKQQRIMFSWQESAGQGGVVRGEKPSSSQRRRERLPGSLTRLALHAGGFPSKKREGSERRHVAGSVTQLASDGRTAFDGKWFETMTTRVRVHFGSSFSKSMSDTPNRDVGHHVRVSGIMCLFPSACLCRIREGNPFVSPMGGRCSHSGV